MGRSEHDLGLTADELKALRSISKWRAPLAIAVTWILIIALFALIYYCTSWWLFLLLSPLLGALQNRLTTLTHEAMHRSLYPTPKGSDFLGKWFCSYPVGNFFHINVIMHLNHHHEFGMQRDPNVLSYTVSRETFLMHDLPKALCGLNLIAALLNFSQKLSNRFRFTEDKAAIDKAERKLRMDALRMDYLRLPLVQLAMISAFHLCGMWWGYLYWLAIRVTWCSAFNAMRLFVEHHSDVSDADPILANTANPVMINTMAGFLERLFIAPLNFNLHGTHHVAPYIPYYKLPLLTKIIQERELKHFLTRKSYLGYVLGREDFSEEEKDLLPIKRRVQNFASE